MDGNAKLFHHIALYGVAERYHLLTGGPAAVYQHQSLPVVDSSPAEAATFPPTLFNHPAGRNLHFVANLIMGHASVLVGQRLIFFTAHHRIHEEAAGITQHLRVGQLLAADIYDDLAQLLCRRRGNVSALQFGTNVAVIEAGTEHPTQPEVDLRDEIAVMPLCLEAALPVTIAADSVGKLPLLARGYIYGPHLLYEFTDFCTVSTDVLNSSSSHVAGYQRQVFCTVESVGQTLVYKPIPLHAAATDHSFAFLLCMADGRAHHNTFEMACQQQVTATANDKVRL